MGFADAVAAVENMSAIDTRNVVAVTAALFFFISDFSLLATESFS
jgi:hypothetical protein